jgi:hypothetical protein
LIDCYINIDVGICFSLVNVLYFNFLLDLSHLSFVDDFVVGFFIFKVVREGAADHSHPCKNCYVDHALEFAWEERLDDLENEDTCAFKKYIYTEGFAVWLELEGEDGVDVDAEHSVLETPEEGHEVSKRRVGVEPDVKYNEDTLEKHTHQNH